MRCMACGGAGGACISGALACREEMPRCREALTGASSAAFSAEKPPPSYGTQRPLSQDVAAMIRPPRKIAHDSNASDQSQTRKNALRRKRRSRSGITLVMRIFDLVLRASDQHYTFCAGLSGRMLDWHDFYASWSSTRRSTSTMAGILGTR